MEEADYNRLLRLGVKHLVSKCGLSPIKANKFVKEYLEGFEEAKQLLEVATENGWNEIVEAYEKL